MGYEDGVDYTVRPHIPSTRELLRTNEVQGVYSRAAKFKAMSIVASRKKNRQ